MLFGLALTLFASVIGVAAGATQGYFGGWTDLLFQRFIEIWTSVPTLYLLIIVAAVITDPGTGIIVCCGSGGVGKTTTRRPWPCARPSAGRKVVVLTIDPARRLAQSMGLDGARQHPAPGARASTSRRRRSSTR